MREWICPQREPRERTGADITRRPCRASYHGRGAPEVAQGPRGSRSFEDPRSRTAFASCASRRRDPVTSRRCKARCRGLSLSGWLDVYYHHVSLFPEIRTELDLPSLGTSYEMEHLDFKVKVDGQRPFELAKDLAAFANCFGGVILVGAQDQDDRLVLYVPLTQVEVDETRKAFLNAVKDRCVPPPRLDLAVIDVPGGFLLAVNVWPMPDQPVAVRAPIEKLPGEKITSWAFVFPIRVHTGTDYLKSPGEIAMLMLPELRCAAIRLDSIPPSERSRVRVWWRVPPSGYSHMDATLVEIDVQGARVVFDLKDQPKGPPRLELPLEAIETVQHLADGIWRVDLRGKLVTDGNYNRAWEGPSK
jgi:Putative DNA-binding domain